MQWIYLSVGVDRPKGQKSRLKTLVFQTVHSKSTRFSPPDLQILKEYLHVLQHINMLPHMAHEKLG